MDPETVFKIGIAIVAIIGTAYANHKIKQLTGKSLWEYLKTVVRDYCEGVKLWLKGNHSFGAEIIRFSVIAIDHIRSKINGLLTNPQDEPVTITERPLSAEDRGLRIEAINAKGQTETITEQTISAEDAKKKFGIAVGQHKDILVADIN